MFEPASSKSTSCAVLVVCILGSGRALSLAYAGIICWNKETADEGRRKGADEEDYGKEEK